MRLRNVKDKDEILKNSEYIIDNPSIYKGRWKDVFSNDLPICLEIGVGKCKFIKEMAIKYPNINFIGIEKQKSVLALGILNIPSNIKNLKLISYDAFKCDEILDKEIDTIYLNFSDPWPKKRHHKRRLTHKSFLEKYDLIFKNKNEIILKTDNRDLFEFSLISLSNYGYILEDVSLDLQNRENSDNIMTEYEIKFLEKGALIYMLKAIKH